MRVASLLVLIAVVACIYASRPALDKEIVEAINGARLPWKAGYNDFFAHMTIDEAKAMMACDVTVPSDIPVAVSTGVAAPAAFDSRTQWPNCIHPIRNQEQCGSCWAFGTTESFSDRMCIATNGSTNVVLSPQDLVSCDKGGAGCNGGIPSQAWQYFADKGVVADSCLPYTAGKGNSGFCPLFKKCKGSGSWTPYKADASSIHIYNTVELIQQAVMTDGPVTATMTVYQDFMSYKSGVYIHTTGSMLGGHAIKIVGWGTDADSKQDYWIVANSWGTTWGINGFFWIQRGTDMCGIEAGCVAGLPAQ
jgi:cathepsin B